MPSFYVRKEDVVSSLAEQLTAREFLKVVEDVLDVWQLAELDEELIARVWNKLKGVYLDGEELPTLDSLVEKYVKE